MCVLFFEEIKSNSFTYSENIYIYYLNCTWLHGRIRPFGHFRVFRRCTAETARGTTRPASRKIITPRLLYSATSCGVVIVVIVIIIIIVVVVVVVGGLLQHALLIDGLERACIERPTHTLALHCEPVVAGRACVAEPFLRVALGERRRR